MKPLTLDGVEVRGRSEPGFEEVLAPDALAFVAELHRRFRDTRVRLLARRLERQREFDAGRLPTLPPPSRTPDDSRAADWTVAPPPKDLLDRRVEITGPVDAKTIINALNSGARVFMADYEDSNAPTWSNCVGGQRNVRAASRRELEFTSGEGRRYRLAEQTATLMVRPRGWHLPEKHLLVDGEPVAASLFDFGLDFFHNAVARVERSSGPYYYLPKLESQLEARLWNDVFCFAQESLGLPRGTIRATVLIETLPAAFEMDEILRELKDHSAGLNCGRWDYIFSAIKTRRADAAWLTPDRAQMTMATGFLRAYSQALVQTCHRRRAHAIGGMAAQIPIKNDPQRNEEAFAKVRADKEREAGDGHDGTWVAHPGLVPLALSVFDAKMAGPHQLDELRRDVRVSDELLLALPKGTRTAAGLATNVSVGLRYLEPWLRGTGCVPIHHLMEDAATAEISRTQIWQWIRHGAALDDGRRVTLPLFRELLQEELAGQREALGPARYAGSRFDDAARIFDELVGARDLPDFLTIHAYAQL